MDWRHVLRLLFLLLMLLPITGKKNKKNRNRSSVCPDYTFCSCYRDTRNRVEIYCFGTENLEPIYNLLVTEFRDTIIKRLDLRKYCYLTSLPSYAFNNCTIERFSSRCSFADIEPNAFAGITSLTTIDLENSTFSDIPEGLINLQYVEALNIKYHNLLSLGNVHWNMSSLRQLRIQHGILEEVFVDTFAQMPNLKYIDLTNNNLANISREVFSASKLLDEIYLGYNLITSAEDIFNETNPTVIDLKYNRLTSLNNVFHEGMGSLQSLDLSGNIFPEIDFYSFGGNLEKLRYFSMEHCDCANINISFPQQFPRIKAVYLGYNNLQKLPIYSFRNHKNMVTLELQFNSITCNEVIFDDIRRLRTLTMDHNNISGISDCFRRLLVLETLQLSHNNILRIQDKDFQGMLQIRTLSLAYNSIEFIGSNSFSSLRYLKQLELSHNKIYHLNGSLRYVTTLNILMLNSCHLQTLTASDFYKVQEITVLDLSDNELTSIDDAFQNFPKLLYLNLANNRLTTISRETLPEKIQLKDLRLGRGNKWNCDCQLLWLFEWLSVSNYTVLKDQPSCSLPQKQKGKIFHEVNIKAVQEIQEECPSPCDCKCGLNGSNLYLSTDCSRKSMTSIPTNLPTNLAVMNLSQNELKTFRISTDWKRLFSLNLEHNKLISFGIGPFQGLREMRLSDNKLSIPPTFMLLENRLEVVTLSNNPWICDCKTIPFRDWLVKNQEKVADLGEVKCRTIGSRSYLSGKVIYTLEASDLCPTFPYVGLIVGLICPILALLCIVLLRYRHHLKSLVYACGLACVKEDDKDIDSIYDGFLSYNWMDEQFMFTNIIPGLQDAVPYFTLYIPNRDVYGEHSNALIAEGMERSKRIVVLLNENYINDESSMAEFRLACDLCLDDEMRRLIFIKNGKLPRAKKLDQHVKCALNSSVCVSWGEKFFWERLRYAMPKKKNDLNLRDMRNHAEQEQCRDDDILLNPQ